MRPNRAQAWRRRALLRYLSVALSALTATTCHRDVPARASAASRLQVVRDVPLPGAANRFDYQLVDLAERRLFIAHMNDDAVVVLSLDGPRVLQLLPHIPTPRGLALGADRVFITSSPAQLVIVDRHTLTELGRVATGRAPDGVAYADPARVVGVSDQGDGALSLLADAGLGPRRQLRLGDETGNVAYDASRALFWITVVTAGHPDRLLAIEPVSGTVSTSLDLAGCVGAHGLLLSADEQSAFVACEDNSRLLRLALGANHAATVVKVGQGPDVLSLDAGLGWLYVAAESGELTLLDVRKPEPLVFMRERIGARAHSVAVDPSSHRAFFPLQAGPSGSPVLRVTRPR